MKAEADVDEGTVTVTIPPDEASKLFAELEEMKRQELNPLGGQQCAALLEALEGALEKAAEDI